MPSPKTSITAYVVVTGIAKFSRMARWKRYISDEMAAYSTLFMEQVADSRLKSLIRKLPALLFITLLDKLYIPGMAYHFLFRKLLIEQQVERSIAGGTQQVIVLGGGFDSLSVRMAAKHPAVRFFEIDLPHTQQSKTAILSRTAALPSNCRFVPANLAEATLESVLTNEQGFVTESPTLVILEGVLMYLTEAEVQSLFQAMHRLFTGTLSVLFGATVQSDDAGSLPLKFINALLKKGNEGTKWFCPSHLMPQFMAALHYQLAAWKSYKQLQLLFRSEAEAASVPAEDENYYLVTKISLPEVNRQKSNLADIPLLTVSNTFTSDMLSVS